jgi:hypothetical protein
LRAVGLDWAGSAGRGIGFRHDQVASRSLGSRARLQAAAVSVTSQPTPGGAAMAGLPQAAGGLHPAEALLDPLASPLARGVLRMARGPAIDRRPPPRGVLRDVGRDVTSAQIGHEARHIVRLVGAQGRAVAPCLAAAHGQRGCGLGGAGGRCQHGIDDQNVPVFHQIARSERGWTPLSSPTGQWPMWQSFGSLPWAFADQPRVGIGGRGMGRVAALLAMEVSLGVASASTFRRLLAVLGF